MLRIAGGEFQPGRGGRAARSQVSYKVLYTFVANTDVDRGQGARVLLHDLCEEKVFVCARARKRWYATRASICVLGS